ncbi:MAG: ribbon-helix-helix domain-containing protein [Alphaproteobacteria bacterium]|nr:ribbon-helix-helix domain-containing protein [Alphaproteobacteria bacterium]
MKKRSVTLKGHRTSITLEAEFWAVLERILQKRGGSLQKLVEEIDATRGGRNLSSAVRVFILEHKADA